MKKWKIKLLHLIYAWNKDSKENYTPYLYQNNPLKLIEWQIAP